MKWKKWSQLSKWNNRINYTIISLAIVIALLITIAYTVYNIKNTNIINCCEIQK